MVKLDEIYLLMVHCDDHSKHDRLITLSRLFEYRNTGTRVVVVHDNNNIKGPTICVSNNLHDSHIIQS